MRVSRAVMALHVLTKRVLVICAVFLPSVTFAGLVASDDEVVVSAGGSADRHHPSVAWGGSYRSSFLVVWDEQRLDLDGVHIFSTFTDGSEDPEQGGGPFQLDAEGSSRNEMPDVVATPNGDYIVVWRRDPQNGERAQIVGVRTGGTQPAATEFQVNTAREVAGAYYLGAPEVAVASDGSFVVVWASGSQDDDDIGYGPATNVFARRFTADAVTIGDDVPISSLASDEFAETEFRPDVAAVGGGGFVVVWAQGQIGQLGSSFLTRARRLDSLGQPSGEEIAVGNGGFVGPRVTGPQSGGFRVVWPTFEYADTVPGFGSDVLARSFDESGSALSDAFLVSTPSRGTRAQSTGTRAQSTGTRAQSTGTRAQLPSETAPAFAGVSGVAGANGGADEFVIAWTSGTSSNIGEYGGSTDSDGAGIFARAVDSTGQAFGPEWQVNETVAGDQVEPDVAVGGNTVLVVWAADQIYAHRFELLVPRCADTDDSDYINASDALFILQAAVGTRACDLCVCDTDGSGARSAADALLVLRSSIGIETSFTCPACDDPFAVGFSLQTDAPCYGAYVDIPYTALPDGVNELECRLDPALEAAGCDVEVYPYSGFTLEIHGCFIDSQPLFSCHVAGGDAEEIALTAEVACGCGCADTCPTAPLLCASLEDGPVCSPGMSLASGPTSAPRVPAVFATLSPPQTLTTSTATCETCCDFVVQADVSLLDEVAASELLLRFEAGRSVECPDEAVECESVGAEGPGYTRVSGNQVDVCMTAPQGITGPALLATCSIIAGDFTSGPVQVLRALDREFRPLDPLPAIVVDDGSP